MNGYGGNLQRDNKNSNHSVIEKNTEKKCFWTFAHHCAVKSKLTPPEVISTRWNVFQVQKHPAYSAKMQKIAEIKDIPYFLPVVYMHIHTYARTNAHLDLELLQLICYAKHDAY